MDFNQLVMRFFRSPIIQYIGTRYLTFGIQFINSVLIAKYLGVYYFGIYSFISLINQYLAYTAMAPAYSLNALLSVRKNDKTNSVDLWRNSVLILLLIVGIVTASWITLFIFSPNTFSKYQFHDFYILVLIIFVFSSLNSLYTNLYRTYGLLGKINLNQFVIPFFQFLVLFFAKEEELLYYLLMGTIVANVFSFIVYSTNPPLKVGLQFKKPIFSELLTRGVNLLLYNVSFYLILLSSRTVVSIYYSAEELGFYTLAVNLSNAVFMIVGSFSFVLFPKLLNKFHNTCPTEAQKLLNNIRSIYIASCYLLTYLGFFAIPLLELLLPQYKQAMPAFKILLLAQLILNNNFGYSILLIAKKKERFMTYYALIGIFIITVISLLFIKIDLSFLFVALSVAIGLTYYCVSITQKAYIEMNQKLGIKKMFQELFPIYYLIPFLVLVISVLIKENIFTPYISFIIFIFMNKKNLFEGYKRGVVFLTDRNSLKF
ncbi:lipopolysaccharide biosynthesis protein [Changchengzhania lutea]|uniref:lipopolysaccharide biosynthesis protein n=1 Tax=Changchengzhania lutea TaxID=2049305 RepID=UPI00115F17C5|nr:oligosaccharide flippase family protein [Changchengzhania lutea]